MNRNVRILAIVLLSLPAILVAGLAALPLGADTAAELARFLPYYWFIPFLALATLLLWRTGWWPSLVVVLAWGLLAFVIAGVRWSSPPAPAAGTHLIRVMTFNTKAFKVGRQSGGIDQIEAEIRAQGADIIALQDADGMLMGVPSSTAQKMPAYLGYPDVYAVGQYIVASKFPLRQCAATELGPNKRSRNFVYCTLVIDDKPLTLVTAHLKSPRYSFLSVRDAPRAGMSDWEWNLEDRLGEAGRLADKIAELPRPLLAMGDFNAREESDVVQTIAGADLRDVFSEAGRGPGFTYGHSVHLHQDFLRIDHILASPGITVYRAEAGTSRVSDHHPVITEISVDASTGARP